MISALEVRGDWLRLWGSLFDYRRGRENRCCSPSRKFFRIERERRNAECRLISDGLSRRLATGAEQGRELHWYGLTRVGPGRSFPRRRSCRPKRRRRKNPSPQIYWSSEGRGARGQIAV